jgi:hypothetical protein
MKLTLNNNDGDYSDNEKTDLRDYELLEAAENGGKRKNTKNTKVCLETRSICSRFSYSLGSRPTSSKGKICL